MIELNEKDADFIANICRDELKMHKEAFDDFVKKIESKTKKAEAISVVLDVADDEKSKELLNELKVAQAKCISEGREQYEKETEKWHKALELLTGGSKEE